MAVKARHNMKLTWTILITTLIFWLAQIILFLLMIASWFVHIFLFIAVLFLPDLRDSDAQAFLSKILTALP